MPTYARTQASRDELLSARKASQYTGVGISTLESKRADGPGPPFYKLGDGPRARVAYRRLDVDIWLASWR